MNLQDVATVFWRDWLVLDRKLIKFVLSRMISPILYLVAFGWGVGRGGSVAGGSYLDFIVPGIMAMNAMNISFSAVGSPLNMSRLYHKTLEEYLIAPMDMGSFVAGKILAGSLRGLISCSVIFLIAYMFGARFLVDVWFLLALALTCLLFAALGLVAGMLTETHEAMGNFTTYVLLPMSFLCATFFSLEKLPYIVQILIEIMPLTHATYCLRSIGSGGGVPWISLGVLIFYTGTFALAGMATMKTVRD
ncbi:MAG TPA: ABC transporter permease [Patescibacteria group bacterium]|nr:ABC transporter permease [Patescibacteria group bacterium]